MLVGLHEKYGIKLLVEAFEKIDNNSIELHLYGNGDCVDYIKNKAKKNFNIKYYGVVPNSQIIEQEKKALLLVNPRLTNKEYTKYSFPSKNIEYMASGTPLLVTKLPGIPKEYNDYLFFIDNESVDGIKKALVNTLNLGHKVLEFRGKEAQKFILNYKNNFIQTKRILDLMKNLQ